MLSDFLFSINATLPVFLIMLFGMFLKRVGMIDDDFTEKLNRFVFRCALPLLMFYDSAKENFLELFDAGFVLFCFLATLASILLSWALSLPKKDKTQQGEFIQACYRSSASLLGVMFAENICGNSKVIPLMVLGAVPAYNVAAVIILTVFQPERGTFDRALARKTAKSIATNPIILGILAGLVWSLLSLPFPTLFSRTLSDISGTASPLGLISLGASFQFAAAKKETRLTLEAVFVKLVLFCLLFVPLAVWLGYRGDQLVAILIMCGSPTTISAYIMAKGFGHSGTLTASCVMLSTLLSAITLTMSVFLLRNFGLL